MIIKQKLLSWDKIPTEPQEVVSINKSPHAVG